MKTSIKTYNLSNGEKFINPTMKNITRSIEIKVSHIKKDKVVIVRKINNTNIKKVPMKFLFITLIFIFLFGLFTISFANNNQSICQGDVTCESRLSRIKECDKKHKDDNAILECVMNITIKKRSKVLKVSESRKIRSEIKELYSEYKGSSSNLLRDATSFIADFEGYRSCAYPDGYNPDGSKRYSIGFGTKSYKGECIEKSEAIRRKEQFVTGILEKVPNCFTYNQKIALSSYIYNTGGNQMGLQKYIKSCDKKNVKYIMSVWGHELRGHQIRRAIEIKKFNSQ